MSRDRLGCAARRPATLERVRARRSGWHRAPLQQDPSLLHADEERYVRAGTEFVTVDIDGLRCSLFVCYDLRFADEFWALAHESDAYFVVANWPAKRRLHWSTLLRARAIENQAYVIGVNRVGSGGGLDYSGDSAIIDPLGEVLATGAGGETILLADLDPAHVATTRDHFRFLQDRR